MPKKVRFDVELTMGRGQPVGSGIKGTMVVEKQETVASTASAASTAAAYVIGSAAVNPKTLTTHEAERAVLFGNEQFAIATIQAVSVAMAIGGFSKFTELKEIFGILPSMLSITCVFLALSGSVLAALYRHEYKKWDIKAAGAVGEERKKRVDLTGKYLARMRLAMSWSHYLVVAALGLLLFSMWWTYLRPIICSVVREGV